MLEFFKRWFRHESNLNFTIGSCFFSVLVAILNLDVHFFWKAMPVLVRFLQSRPLLNPDKCILN